MNRESEIWHPPSLLPELEVIQQQYCDQKMTDEVLRDLQIRYPGVMVELRESFFDNVTDYRNCYYDVIDYLRSDASPAFNFSRLALIDLLFELHRRLMSGLRQPVPELRGTSLKSASGEKFVPLIPLPVISRSGDYKVSQELTDQILQKVYQERPDIVFEVSECERRYLPSVEQNREFIEFMNSMELSVTGSAVSSLFGELHRRVLVMCGIWSANGEPK